MTDGERLVGLIIEAKRTDPETGSFTDYLADYLLEHGVIVEQQLMDGTHEFFGGIDNDDLKPCPFCGGEAQIEHEYTGVGHSYVRCKKCGLKSASFMRSFEIASDTEAIKYWNRRAENA